MKKFFVSLTTLALLFSYSCSKTPQTDAITPEMQFKSLRALIIPSSPEEYYETVRQVEASSYVEISSEEIHYGSYFVNRQDNFFSITILYPGEKVDLSKFGIIQVSTNNHFTEVRKSTKDSTTFYVAPQNTPIPSDKNVLKASRENLLATTVFLNKHVSQMDSYAEVLAKLHSKIKEMPTF